MPVSPNVLARQSNKALPNLAWVRDIAYVRTRSGWLYLAAVRDLHSRKLAGWAMAPEMHATLVCTALQMAIAQPVWSCIQTDKRSTQAPSIKGC